MVASCGPSPDPPARSGLMDWLVTLLLSWDTPWSLLGIDRSLPLLTGSRGCLRIAGTRFAWWGLLELAVDVACSLTALTVSFPLGCCGNYLALIGYSLLCVLRLCWPNRRESVCVFRCTIRFQMHNQYAHSRPVRSTSYFKNLIRYVASYIQGDSARYRRSLSVSRTSKFAQALARPPDDWRRLSLAWVTLLLSWDTPWSLWGLTDLCRF